MNDEFYIEVLLTPHPWDNEKEPYFWCLFKWCVNQKNEKDGAWCNYGAGWAKTPADAFQQANSYYERFYKDTK